MSADLSAHQCQHIFSMLLLGTKEPPRPPIATQHGVLYDNQGKLYRYRLLTRWPTFVSRAVLPRVPKTIRPCRGGCVLPFNDGSKARGSLHSPITPLPLQSCVPVDTRGGCLPADDTACSQGRRELPFHASLPANMIAPVATKCNTPSPSGPGGRTHLDGWHGAQSTLLAYACRCD